MPPPDTDFERIRGIANVAVRVVQLEDLLSGCRAEALATIDRFSDYKFQGMWASMYYSAFRLPEKSYALPLADYDLSVLHVADLDARAQQLTELVHECFANHFTNHERLEAIWLQSAQQISYMAHDKDMKHHREIQQLSAHVPVWPARAYLLILCGMVLFTVGAAVMLWWYCLPLVQAHVRRLHVAQRLRRQQHQQQPYLRG